MIEDVDEGWTRGVYDVLKAEPNASRLRDRVDFVFSNKDKAAGVRDPTRSVLTLDLLFLALEEGRDDNDDEASLARRASKVSALLAAHSRSLLDEIRKGEDDIDNVVDTAILLRTAFGSIFPSCPDSTIGVPSIFPQVIIGD